MPEEGPIPAKSLYDKLLALMDKVSYVRKRGRNEFHKYKYARAEDVLGKVQAGLIKVRLVAYPQYEVVSSEKTEKGVIVTVRCALTIADADGPEFIVAISLGSGSDTGDKAVMKAMTAAHKYAWLHTLNIATGDDPEADESTDRRAAEGMANAR